MNGEKCLGDRSTVGSLSIIILDAVFKFINIIININLNFIEKCEPEDYWSLGPEVKSINFHWFSVVFKFKSILNHFLKSVFSQFEFVTNQFEFLIIF